MVGVVELVVVVEPDPDPSVVVVVPDPDPLVVVVVTGGGVVLSGKSPPSQPKWNEPGHSLGSSVHSYFCVTRLKSKNFSSGQVIALPGLTFVSGFFGPKHQKPDLQLGPTQISFAQLQSTDNSGSQSNLKSPGQV